MRVEYINPFVESAFNVLKEVLNTEVKRGELYLKSTSDAGSRGGGDRRSCRRRGRKGSFRYDASNGDRVASAMNGEELPALDDLGKATITELANMITAQAVTKLHDLGFKFDLTPPAIFTGENMEVSDPEVEALIVPMELPQGKVEINVAIRERA